MRMTFFLAWAALVGAAPGPSAPPHVALHGRFERRFDVPHPGVDADDVRIHAIVTGPSGRITTVGGFASHGEFAFRFAPRQTGLHRYVVRADAGGGEREVASGTFVADATGTDPGFVHVDAKRPHHLAFDDGSPLLVLGENRINIYDPTWNDGHADIESYVARMAAAGMTTLRVFVFDDAEAEDRPDRRQLGALEPRVGRFDEQVAERFDRIFEAAERHGVYVVLTLHAIGFSTGEGETWKSWEDNPYSAARGGPAASPRAFFEDAALRPVEARKLDYAIDRWGYSTHLLAIDLLNEPEWDGRIPETSWIPWAEWMSAHERAHDPYGHLVTAGSVGLHWNVDGDERPWYASPANSAVEWHLYGKEYYEPHALARELTRKVEETYGDGKPVVCGEFAYGGEDHVTYDHTHVGIWTLLMSGAGAVAHSAPPFQIDSDEPMTRARAAHFRVLSDFLRDARAGELEPRRDLSVEPRDAAAWSLRSETGDRRAIWLLAGERGYGRRVLGARVTVPELPAGRYRVSWRDDVTGASLETASIASDGHAPVTLDAPPFVRHVAAIVEPAR